jgi:hypothetical protein
MFPQGRPSPHAVGMQLESEPVFMIRHSGVCILYHECRVVECSQ